MATRTIEATIQGQVQGVGFRAWTQEMARRLSLRGWVRNEDDGSVRALISGDSNAVAAMQEALWQGPRASSVGQVTVIDAPATECKDFDIRY